MKLRLLPVIALAALVQGCFTISQSEYPSVELSQAKGDDVRISLSGFETTEVSYTPVYGYSTVWGGSRGYWHRGHYHGGWVYPQTVSTTTYIPESRISTEFAERAQDAFESAGYIVSATNPTYTVDLKFTGGGETDSDGTYEALCMLFTLLTTDWTRETWTARLKITDSATGKVVFSRAYAQTYSATVWGPIPLFSPLGATEVSGSFIKGWCLSALTDRAVADATAYLSQL